MAIAPELSEFDYYAPGQRFASAGDQDRAITDFRRVLEQNPRAFLTYALRGLSYREKEDSDRALADFTMAIDIEPQHSRAFYYHGLIFLLNGESGRACDHMRLIAVSQKEPSAPEYLASLTPVHNVMLSAGGNCARELLTCPKVRLSPDSERHNVSGVQEEKLWLNSRPAR